MDKDVLSWFEKHIENTPIVRLDNFSTDTYNIWAKFDFLNPSGSVKDAMALYMIQKAEEKGMLREGSEIVEATTGNTGIAFAMLSAARGYKFTAVMPEFIHSQKIDIIKAYGGGIILTPAKKDVIGAVKKVEDIIKKNPKAWCPRQFYNPDNIEAHRRITGRKILQQLGKKRIHIDAFVAGVGTGGTLIGVSRAIKKRFPHALSVAVEPAESAVLSGKKPGKHGIEGIGEGFIPALVNLNEIDVIIRISTSEAIAMARRLATKCGILCGISSGANVLAAIKIAKKLGKGNIITTLPDRGERYLDLLI